MGAEFIAEEGVLKGLIISLAQGEEWTIGRDPDQCAIVIEDPQTSRLHLRVRKSDEGFTLENLSETKPTLINGNPVHVPTLLQEGDLITIGETLFSFHARDQVEGYGFEFEAPQEPAPLEQEQTEEPMIEEEIFEPEEPAFEPEEPIPSEILFEEPTPSDVHIDLTPTTRFLLKIIAGPNTGAEFALDFNQEYLIGTDATSCDIIFNDLSVSREHARLRIAKDGTIFIEDLGSRNGVVIDNERISEAKELHANAIVALGTSAFLLIDREAPSETISAPLFEVPADEEKEEMPQEEVAAKVITPSKMPRKARLQLGTLILALIICGFAILVGMAMVSLFQTVEIEQVEKDQLAEIQSAIKDFPAVRFTYNKLSGKLFLMGHVRTGVEYNELLYKVHGLDFIQGIDDNIVNDEAVWQEMNILLSKHTQFKGVSMHSPRAGEFVISGYLETEKQASNLTDYLNINFNYLNLLQNRVIVEQSLMEEVKSDLLQGGFGAVSVTFSNGDLQLTGYISSTQLYEFDKLIALVRQYPGVRHVKNFVVAVTPEQGVIDLNKKYPGRYRVTGYSTHGDININVVINGKIVTRGDTIDGYTITSIHPHTIFLEQEGLKYKIEYNK